ncbi:Z1 domain-containing protein [Aquihabitans daechungensis]|uniref:Z1 domain-containing protein n=1 Tax=Aquihabitans daechungensis TaxID=1052257 RepID=UPI003BA36E9C
MGAVQSGKTASMLGVAALSLDAGIDMVVILAGTRTSLWRQTLDRVLQQLDRGPDAATAAGPDDRILVPDPAVMSRGDDERSPSEIYAMNGPMLRRALAERRPIIAVVMKNIHHLSAMANVIDRRLIPAIERAGRPFHMVVVDDEADDGSILDARIESRLDPALDDFKRIPRGIVDLWEARPRPGQTASGHLSATYIGYTATPHANFLQSDHNPLAPREFAVSLRTPFDRGNLTPRSTTYREPNGLHAFYTGGEAFYSRLNATRTCQPTSSQPDTDLTEAVRAFLIAGAIRIWRGTDRLRPSQAQTALFASRAEAARRSPKPHSMLFHPSPVIADQFEAAADILRTTCGTDASASIERIRSGDRALPVADMQRMIDSDEMAWVRWLSEYEESASAVRDAFDVPQPHPVPKPSQWPEIRAIILDEVLPVTRIKVVNSDPDADDRPAFEPIEQADGQWMPPPDLSTIFVSGNVMSRGLTLEGLTTTLFLRGSNDPYADTQMQMQRWFGYRGDYLDLCRVFLPAAQLDLFRAYHDDDEALRRTVITAMNEATDGAPDPYVLQGRDFIATGKITNLTNVPLCPGATPFVRLVNNGHQEDLNVKVVADAFNGALTQPLIAKGLLRGQIVQEPLSLTEAASLLDKLRYDHFRPAPDGWEGSRWKHLEAQVGIDDTSDIDHLLPFFRPPEVPTEQATKYLRGGPYAIAAYLRLWKACLSHSARGLFATNDSRNRWSMLDLAKKASEQPVFYVGIRYGSGAEIDQGPLGELPFSVRAMKRTVSATIGELDAGWGSRNPGAGPGEYLGDELFDYHLHGKPPPTPGPGEPVWRPVGAPGLILFHIIERPDRPFPTVAVGVALPLGGPDQFAARNP